ncbi:MAG: hypothetical protein RR768_02120 [Clostridium sp.]
MRITFRELLKKADVGVSTGVYAQESSDVLDFLVAEEAFMEVVPGAVTDGIFDILDQRSQCVNAMKECAEYRALLHAWHEAAEQIKAARNDVEEIRQLRIRKKELEADLRDLEQQYENTANRHLFGTDVHPGTMISFKQCVIGTSMRELAKKIPLLRKIKGNKLWEMPIFTDHISELCRALKEKRKLGVIGGPCLFGKWEMGIIIAEKDGESLEFDFSSGRKYQRCGECIREEEGDVEDYIRENADHIKAIHFKNYKQNLTSQEYDALQYVYEFADKFCAPAFIPIPDLSYQKYLKSLLVDIEDETIKEEAEAEFCLLSAEAAKLFINCMKRLSQEYPNVDVTILHNGEEELKSIFEEKKEYYLKKKPRLLRQLTRRVDWKEAIKDYITMPALPFYLNGIRDIIEVDCIDEMESYRKCLKIHGNELNIYPFFYADRLSKDGKHAIFYAAPEFKEYPDIGGEY